MNDSKYFIATVYNTTSLSPCIITEQKESLMMKKFGYLES